MEHNDADENNALLFVPEFRRRRHSRKKSRGRCRICIWKFPRKLLVFVATIIVLWEIGIFLVFFSSVDSNLDHGAVLIQDQEQPNQFFPRKPTATFDSSIGNASLATVPIKTVTNEFPKFVGTRRTALSLGLDRYTHVCLKRQVNRHLEFQVFGGTDDGAINDTFESFPPRRGTMMEAPILAQDKYFEWILSKHVVYPLSQWHRQIRHILKREAQQNHSHSNTHYIRNTPVLLTVDIFQNPGHCLADLVWSLALDRYERTRGVDENSLPFQYPAYIFGNRDGFHDGNDGDLLSSSWCHNLIQATQWMGPRLTIATDPLVCFDELWIPSFGLFRFPLSTLEQVSSLRQYTFLWRHFKTHNFNRTAWNWTYPTEALESVRTSIANSLGLTTTSWNDTSQTQSTMIRHVLILDRLGNPRRQWKNAAAVAKTLQQKSLTPIEIRLVHEPEWQQLSFTQQIQLVHNYSHIITVHAGAQANFIACRPGTRIVELACLNPGDRQANSSLSVHRDENNVEWQGPVGWYSSFTRRLGMRHFILSDTLTCTGGAPGARRHDAAEIVANVDRTVQFLKSRLGL